MTIAALKQALAGQEIAVLAHYGINLTGRGHLHCPLPDHADKNPSWRWDESTRRYYCSCGTGDIIDLVQRLEGSSKQHAIERLEEWLGGSAKKRRIFRVKKPTVTQQQEKADTALQSQRAIALWHKATPIAGTLAARYLQQRGLTPPYPDSLRYLQNCKHFTGNFYPAMLALVQDAQGHGIAIQRTYLTSHGRKAAIERPKASYGSTAGGSVWLGTCQRRKRLIIGEGVETVLSAMQLGGVKAGLACLGTAGLRRVVLPKGVKEVAICADNDANGQGQQAARYLAERLQQEQPKIIVTINMPVAGYGDFNDVLLAQQTGEMSSC